MKEQPSRLRTCLKCGTRDLNVCLGHIPILSHTHHLPCPFLCGKRNWVKVYSENVSSPMSVLLMPSNQIMAAKISCAALTWAKWKAEVRDRIYRIYRKGFQKILSLKAEVLYVHSNSGRNVSWADLQEVVLAVMPDGWNLRNDGLLQVKPEFCLIFHFLQLSWNCLDDWYQVMLKCLDVGCGSSGVDTLLSQPSLLWEWEPSEKG